MSTSPSSPSYDRVLLEQAERIARLEERVSMLRDEITALRHLVQAIERDVAGSRAEQG